MRKKPVQTYLSEELDEILRDISECDGKPVAQILREILETLTPGLRQARDMMIAARDMNEAARKKIIPEIVRHGEQLEKNVKYSLENIEKTLKDSD